jgi:hypothetical protein
VLYCRAAGFLEAAIELDADRLRALDPEVDLKMVESHLASFTRICRGGADAGPIGELAQAERFRWLTAPRSTVLQTSEVHEGVCESPQDALQRALDTHVR